MSGQLVTEVGAPQGVKIEMVHAGRDDGRIVSTDSERAFELEGAMRKFGISAELQFAIFRRRREIESAGEFAVERKFADMNPCGDDRVVESTATLQS